MSFRHKNAEAEAETQTGTEDDMKVVHAQGEQPQQPQAPQPQAAEASQQQAESQTSDQSSESDSEQTDDGGDGEDDSEPVPDGTTAEILKWVGDDKKRAQRALDKEQSEKKPRGGLTGGLKEILGS